MGKKPQDDNALINNYEIIITLMNILSILAFLIVLITGFGIINTYLPMGTPFQFILGIEESIFSFFGKVLPIREADHNIIRGITIFIAIALSFVFGGVKGRYRYKIQDIHIKKEYEEWKAQKRLPRDKKAAFTIKRKIEGLSTSSRSEREDLLRLFAETKKKLDEIGRNLAFLAVDVVDSIGMKQGEEKANIEYSFVEYKRFIESKLKANGALKSAWTPDGSMTAFPTVDAAVQAAQEIIMGLKSFNQNIKTIKKDFRVRCGINEGFVYFDLSLPLEEISDHVIDVAGHMQKMASHNSIYISKSAMESMKDRIEFIPTNRKVDGLDTYIWQMDLASKEVGMLGIMEDSILNGKRILAIDDEPDVLKLLEEEILGVAPKCNFEKAMTHRDAMNKLESQEYDLVILDIMGVRGFDLLKLAVQRNFKVAILTAHAFSPDALKNSLELKARAYLPKEKLGEIVPFLEDILRFKYLLAWKRLFDKMEGFFNERWGEHWKMPEEKFWKEFAQRTA